MGAGKSTVGRLLAQKLNKKFLDIDKEIETSENKAIKDIFSEHGENYFRKIESRILTNISNEQTDLVVSTGGGIVTNDLNIQTMKKSGNIVYLKADIDVLWDRVKNSKNRPLLNVPGAYERAKELFSNRESLYEKADHIIVTNNKSLEDVVNKIIYILN